MEIQSGPDGAENIAPAKISPESIRDIQATLTRWFAGRLGGDADTLQGIRTQVYDLFQHCLWQADEIERLMEVRDSLTDQLHSAKGASQMADRLERLREEATQSKDLVQAMRGGLLDIISSLRDADQAISSALGRANAECSRKWTTFLSPRENG